MSSLIPHKVSENPYSVTARRASYKSPVDAKRMVQAESLLEYDFFSVLDFDYRVSKYKEQAIVIPWRTPSGQYQRYTADALVSFRHNFPESKHMKSAVFEVKPTEIIRLEWDTLLPKYRGIRRSLQGTFVPFKVITERNLNPEFVKNCKFLNEYSDKALRLDKAHPFQHEMRSVITEKAKELQVMTPRILLDSISKDFHTQSELVPWMWNQFSHFIHGMQMDMMKPLNMNTEIWHATSRHRLPDWLRRENDWYR